MKLVRTYGDGIKGGGQREIFIGILETDVLNHAANQFVVFREQTSFHFVAEKIAQYATEVLMAWKG